MRTAAIVELVLCWVVWFLAFVRAKKKHSRPSEVTVSTSRWGIVLQAVGYFCLFTFDRRPRERLYVGMVLLPMTVAFTWWAVSHLGKQWRVQAGLYKDHQLVQSGPYSLVRHPIYLSMILMGIGAGSILTSWLLMAIGMVFLIAGTEVRVRVEDRLLGSHFGEEFERFHRSVPAYIPFVR